MSLGFNFSFGRLLSNTEKLTPAKVNAIVKGIVATLTGTVGTVDLDAGAVTPAKTATGAYFYASGTLGGSTYTATYSPAIGSYTDGLVLAFKAGSANSGAANLDAGAGAKPIRKHAGTPLETGDVLAGQIVEVRYNSTLVAGGCWEMTSLPGQAEASTASIVAAMRNLFATNNAVTPTSKANLTADEVLLKNSTGSPFVAANVNVTVDVTVSGVNGLDTGTEANSRWYYLWIIYNPTTATIAGLLSLSATAPTMPAGYSYKALVSAIRNDTGGDFVNFFQVNRDIDITEFVVFTSETGHSSWQEYAINNAAPLIARRLRGNMGTNTSNAFSIAVCGMPNGATPAAITSGTIGVVRGHAGNSSIAALGTFVNAVPFEVAAFPDAGNMVINVAMGNASSIYALTITGFSL